MLEASRAWTIFIVSFISSFEINKVVIPEPYFFFFFYFLYYFLNNDPKNPPDWIILEIGALESFKSVDILLLKTFFSFVVCLVVSHNSCGRSFPLNIFKLILRVVAVLFLTAVFSFSCVSDN